MPSFQAETESNRDMPMDLSPSRARGAARTAGTALLQWWRAATLEALCIGLLWWLGLGLLHVPFAPLWALLAAFASFIPHFGGVLAVIGPTLAVCFSGHDLYRLGLVLGLYGVIVILEQLVIQPLLLKRTTRVPIWASILVPILLGILIPFWGVLLAPPLLAVFYAFRRPRVSS
jgi:predicted PurR-regulated permease PerM